MADNVNMTVKRADGGGFVVEARPRKRHCGHVYPQLPLGVPRNLVDCQTLEQFQAYVGRQILAEAIRVFPDAVDGGGRRVVHVAESDELRAWELCARFFDFDGRLPEGIKSEDVEVTLPGKWKAGDFFPLGPHPDE